ncbi:MAG: RsmB/NOP family class I SAM-dependent RNA methyltransferase [Gemmatimonadales bacterium]
MSRRTHAAPRGRGTIDPVGGNARLNDTGLAPRRAALTVLAAIRRGVPFDVALERELHQLPDADRRLTHELAAGVLRHSRSLDALITRFVPRGLGSVSPPLLDVLRVGAYQLRLLDRVPPHAAVATSVALARERVGERVSGFTNAVLRRVAELPREIATVPTSTDEPDLADAAAAARLAQLWSHPAWLVTRWLARFGTRQTEQLLHWNNSHPRLILQPTRGTNLDLEELLDEHEIPSTPAPFGAGTVVTERRPDRLPGFDTGEFVVQDPAQALVVRFAEFPADAVVYDACAAPGGKTIGIGGAVRGVVAADVSRRRVGRLKENIARAGHGNEWPVVADAAHPPVRPVTGYLLDAPCLGTGTFARHPDARLRVTPEALMQLAGEQRVLLDAAAARIAPGGVLCYATCSLEPEENEMQVAGFLNRHPGFRREPPRAFPGDILTPDGDLLTLPQRDGLDGAFAARLVRRA